MDFLLHPTPIQLTIFFGFLFILGSWIVGKSGKQQEVHDFLLSLLETGPWTVLFLAFIITVSSLASLVGVDVYIGKISAEHMTKNPQFALFASLAITGLTTGALTMFFISVRDRDKWGLGWIAVLFVGSLLFILGDLFLDSSSVDIMRFGRIVYSVDELLPPEARAHNVFRGMMAFVSLFGEPVAASAIVIFPLMSEFFDSAFKKAQRVKGRTIRNNTPAPPVARPATASNQQALDAQRQAQAIRKAQQQAVHRNQQNQQVVTHRPEPTYHPVNSNQGPPQQDLVFRDV